MNPTPTPSEDPADHWSAPVVEAVSRHMNDDHAPDCLLLVRTLGGVPDATSTRMTGMGPAGIVLLAQTPAGSREAAVTWLSVPVDRSDVRRQVVALCEAAARVGG